MSIELDEIKSISAEEFGALDQSKVTVLDLRESAEVLIHPIPGAVNIPFDKIYTNLDTIPKDKPVYVICRTGDWSEEVAEILQDREYEVYNVAGGFQAYRAYLEQAAPLVIDARDLRCPGPIVKVSDTIRDLPVGSRVVVEATEEAFQSDIQVWCDRTGHDLTSLTREDGIIRAAITKRDGAQPTAASAGNDKTFIVFSGDLDKTIASFILANGAASMGRKVTMFFTFWGLNILRRPEKVSIAKSFIEKMFGIMMPRGTKKLGLSRMNMGGAGSKMIRGIMKKKGILSLEELIDSARAHGVRLVACQMSMDIMGIHQEELIDGVELGGVATFIGSGEQSDISLFI